MSDHAQIRITVDVPERGKIRITVKRGNEVIATRELPYEGPVDNQLLTAIDNLFQENILDQFVSIHVEPGQGIDKSSLLYRIIITLSAALERARVEGR